jgi:hypothetical protein
MSSFYDHGMCHLSSANVLLITIAAVSVLAFIYVRFIKKW